MRLRHPSGRIVHLSCGISLAHAETLTAVVERLDSVTRTLRAHFGAGTLDIALRLPYALAGALAASVKARSRLRAELDARDLEVVTLSGIADAGDPPADWSDTARLRHTLDLARILVDVLPAEEVRGSIATCGLGRADNWDEERGLAGARNLSKLSGGLADLAWRVGRAVRAGFQPAPGSVLDSPEQTVAALTQVDKDRLGLCLDLATVVRDWPDPADGIDRITDAGLSVITARITDPAAGWQPVLRHLLAADTARTEYVDVDTEESARDLAYVLEELTDLGLAPEHQPCPAP